MRSSKDWHAFFEMCAIFGTLIADEDALTTTLRPTRMGSPAPPTPRDH